MSNSPVVRYDDIIRVLGGGIGASGPTPHHTHTLADISDISSLAELRTPAWPDWAQSIVLASGNAVISAAATTAGSHYGPMFTMPDDGLLTAFLRIENSLNIMIHWIELGIQSESPPIDNYWNGTSYQLDHSYHVSHHARFQTPVNKGQQLRVRVYRHLAGGAVNWNYRYLYFTPLKNPALSILNEGE